MPCDSIITNRVDLPKMHPDLLTRALKDLKASNVRTYGNTVTFTVDGETWALRNGVLEGAEGQSQAQVGRMADRLKNGYSHQVVRATAARNGWTVKQVGANNYVVQKR